jgi:hypothetical protein
MTKRKVWRYYCEFCRKSGGSAGHMSTHEKHCTLNPNRSCRMCDSNTPIPNHLLALKITSGLVKDPIKGHHEDRESMSVEVLEQVRQSVDGCPACILAIIRQSNQFPDNWSYKKAAEEWWAERNAEAVETCGF